MWQSTVFHISCNLLLYIVVLYDMQGVMRSERSDIQPPYIQTSSAYNNAEVCPAMGCASPLLPMCTLCIHQHKEAYISVQCHHTSRLIMSLYHSMNFKFLSLSPYINIFSCLFCLAYYHKVQVSVLQYFVQKML